MSNLYSLAVDVCAPQFQAVEDACQQLLTITNIDDSVGTQLDILGNIVGQPRNSLIDATYRLYLRARIKASLSSGTRKDIYAVFFALFGLSTVMEITTDVASLELTITTILTHAQGLVGGGFLRDSKGAGIRSIFRWQETDDAHAFCFDGGTGLGFDDHSSPGAGGAFVGASD